MKKVTLVIRPNLVQVWPFGRGHSQGCRSQSREERLQRADRGQDQTDCVIGDTVSFNGGEKRHRDR